MAQQGGARAAAGAQGPAAAGTEQVAAQHDAHGQSVASWTAVGRSCWGADHGDRLIVTAVWLFVVGASSSSSAPSPARCCPRWDSASRASRATDPISAVDDPVGTIGTLSSPPTGEICDCARRHPRRRPRGPRRARRPRTPLAELKERAAPRARPRCDALAALRAAGRRGHRRGQAVQPVARARWPPSPTRPRWPRDYEAGGAARHQRADRAAPLRRQPRRPRRRPRRASTSRCCARTSSSRSYQVWEARAHGADLVLLIVAALEQNALVVAARAGRVARA